MFKKQYQADLKKVGLEEEITQLAKKETGTPLLQEILMRRYMYSSTSEYSEKLALL